MRRFGVISLMFVGFVAGIIFVYSCGGGGSVVLAEITDVTGLEAGLDAINSSIQGIDATTDTTGIESVLNTVASAVGGITLSTDMSGVVSELQNIDVSLQEIVVALQGSQPQTPLTIPVFTDVTVPQAGWVTSDPISIDGYSEIVILGVSGDGGVMVYMSTIIGNTEGGMGNIAPINTVYTQDIVGDSVRLRLWYPAQGNPSGAIASLSIQLL